MGLLDQLTGVLGQQTGSSGQSNQLMELALNLINTHPWGLQGLLQQLGGSGLAQQAQSWASRSAEASLQQFSCTRSVERRVRLFVSHRGRGPAAGSPSVQQSHSCNDAGVACNVR